MTISLLPRAALLNTGDVDHAVWNYDGLLGFVSRRRFALVRALLPRRRVGKLLEVGYGSGVFFPELAKHAERLYGADVHDRAADVTSVLAQAGIPVQLVTAPAEALPYADDTFDVVVAVSAVEFFTDARRAITELARVLAPDGRIIVVTPGKNPLLDVALRVFTGESAEKDFGDRRKRVVPTLPSELRHERSAYFPLLFPIPVYHALRLAKRTAFFSPEPSRLIRFYSELAARSGLWFVARGLLRQRFFPSILPQRKPSHNLFVSTIKFALTACASSKRTASSSALRRQRMRCCRSAKKDSTRSKFHRPRLRPYVG